MPLGPCRSRWSSIADTFRALPGWVCAPQEGEEALESRRQRVRPAYSLSTGAARNRRTLRVGPRTHALKMRTAIVHATASCDSGELQTGPALTCHGRAGTTRGGRRCAGPTEYGL